MTTGEVIALIKAFGGGAGGGGTGGGVLVVHDVDGTLDKTWQEINDAGFAVMNEEGAVFMLCSFGEQEGTYYVRFYSVNGPEYALFTTDSASGYPSYSE